MADPKEQDYSTLEQWEAVLADKERFESECRSAEMDSSGTDANGRLDWPGMYAADVFALLSALQQALEALRELENRLAISRQREVDLENEIGRAVGAIVDLKTDHQIRANGVEHCLRAALEEGQDDG